jgi:hypothetical protein
VAPSLVFQTKKLQKLFSTFPSLIFSKDFDIKINEVFHRIGGGDG